MQYKVNYNFADKCKTYDMIYIKEYFCNGKWGFWGFEIRFWTQGWYSSKQLFAFHV